MKRSAILAASLASAIGLFAIGATAQTQTQTQTRMSISEVALMLEGQGYKVLEIELERGRYDVEMLDTNGMKVEAYLNAVTGEVLPYRDDDCSVGDDRSCDRYDD